MTKSYAAGAGKVSALRGVDLSVGEGELLMLVGPSGCGKTSLLSIIATVLDADQGSCMVLGYDLHLLTSRDRGRFRNESLGFVFQIFNLLPALNALENVSVPLLIGGARRHVAERRAAEMLDAVGLADRRGSLPRQMSGGQQQRVAIARALVGDPKLILCDEPTSSLDHESGQSVMELLRRHATRPNRAMIVVTHDARIFNFADRIARMDDGRIVDTSQAAHAT